MKIKVWYLLLLFPLIFSFTPAKTKSQKPVFIPEDVKIAVLSDIHVMVPQLVEKQGKAFEHYIHHDRKLLKESTAIIQEAIARLIAEKPQIVLITGDLTKDGEYVNHQYVVDSCLSKLKRAGIQTLVVPGNHDINNPHAVAFNGDKTNRIRTITADEFAECYADYGFAHAIARDRSSLTYVAQPAKGLRIVCIDDCRYDENDFHKNTCVTGGRIKPETMDFIKKQVADAHSKGIRIIGMMHHGFVQHWAFQDIIMKDYLVSHWKKTANTFAEIGLSYVFTGHFHAQDIVKHKKGDQFVYDIETGSTVTYPCPFRIVNIRGEAFSVESRHIDKAALHLGNLSFEKYARKYAEEGLQTSVGEYLPKEFSPAAARQIKQSIAKAVLAHYSGDERLSKSEKQELNIVYEKVKEKKPQLAFFVKKALNSLWTDYYPADNNVELGTGNTLLAKRD